MIRFEGVHKWFDKLHVLNNINLHVRSGEVVVVCGPSGSGKSTLIRTMLYPTEIFLFIAVIYFIMCFDFTELSRWLERRLAWRKPI